MNNPARITATRAIYIKLGTRGDWEERAISEGKIFLGFHDVPDALGREGDAKAIRDLYVELGRSRMKGSDYARQVLDFYKDDQKIWVTFANGYLYWCFAEQDVKMMPYNTTDEPSRYRIAKSGWRNTSISGKPLVANQLNGSLTKTAAYRSSICDISPVMLDYLLRRINDEETEAVKAALAAEKEMLSATIGLMQQLQPGDFEVLVDLVFTQSGWRRQGIVGGTTKVTDMEISLPSTGEQGMIQVKSHTTQAELEEYVAAFEARGLDRMFYVYHSSKTRLAANNPKVVMIDNFRMAKLVLDAGCFGWLLQKVC